MNKSPQNLKVKEKSGFWLLNPASKSESVLLSLLFLFLPTQLGKHFWPSFSLVDGIRIDYLAPTLYVTDILLFLLFFFWLNRVGLNAFWNYLLNHKKVILCLGVFLLTALLASRPVLGVYWFIKLIEFTLLGFYIAKTIRFSYQLYVIGLLFSISVFFESFLAILQYINQASLNGWLYFLGERMFSGSTPGIANASIDGTLLLRPYGTFPHPNVLAGYFVVSTVFLAVFLIGKSRGFIRYFGVAVLMLSSIALFLTLSRVAIVVWFVLVCCLLFWVVFRKNKSFKKSMTLAIIIGSFISLILLPFSKTILVRFAESSFTEEAFLHRTELLVSAGRMIQENPLLGVGLGNFIPSLAPLQEPLSLGLYLQPVHNIFLLIVAEVGIICFGIVMWFLGRTIVRLVQNIKTSSVFPKEYIAFSGLLALVLFIGCFDHYFLTLQQGQLLTACILGLCWANLHETHT